MLLYTLTCRLARTVFQLEHSLLECLLERHSSSTLTRFIKLFGIRDATQEFCFILGHRFISVMPQNCQQLGQWTSTTQTASPLQSSLMTMPEVGWQLQQFSIYTAAYIFGKNPKTSQIYIKSKCIATSNTFFPNSTITQ